MNWGIYFGVYHWASWVAAKLYLSFNLPHTDLFCTLLLGNSKSTQCRFLFIALIFASLCAKHFHNLSTKGQIIAEQICGV